MIIQWNKEADAVKDLALGILYPRRCPVCDELVGILEFEGRNALTAPLIHAKCRKKIVHISGNICMKCGKRLTGAEADNEYCRDCLTRKHVFDRGFGVFDYRSISGSIYRFKYMGRQEYADFYADEISRLYKSKLRSLGVEALIPVPMYKGKERKRGYNQAAVLARKLSLRLGIPCCENVITRTVNTLPMKQLDARGRRNNLKKAFNIARNDVKFKCILIIDDIYTTGSTIDEIAHEFRVVGVDRVLFLTLAIGQTT